MHAPSDGSRRTQECARTLLAAAVELSKVLGRLGRARGREPMCPLR